MDEATLRALRGSIAKWRRVVNCEEGTSYALEWRTCPLCVEFYSMAEEQCCNGCPVMKRTGLSHCRGTPYASFSKALDNPTRLIAAAEAELAFLRSLLPPGTPEEEPTT